MFFLFNVVCPLKNVHSNLYYYNNNNNNIIKIVFIQKQHAEAVYFLNSNLSVRLHIRYNSLKQWK